MVYAGGLGCLRGRILKARAVVPPEVRRNHSGRASADRYRWVVI